MTRAAFTLALAFAAAAQARAHVASPAAPVPVSTAAQAASPQDSARLTLADALRGALERYPSLAAARAARDAASASLGEARAPLLPRISLDAQVTRYQLPSIVYPLHSLSLGPGATLPVFDRTLAQGSASLSWTLWDFGARGGRIHAAQAVERAAGATVDAAEAALVARVA